MLDDYAWVDSQPVGVRHLGNGVAVPQVSDAAVRAVRWILLRGVQNLLAPYTVEKIDPDTGEIKTRSEFRVSVCGRSAVDDHVHVYQNGNTFGVAGVYRCGSVWSCPPCAAKVSSVRAEQLGKLFQHVHSSGGSAVMATFTAAHALGDPLADLLARFKKAKMLFQQQRVFRSLKASGLLGYASATEITWSPRNGWHPHQHDALFFDHAVDADQLAADLFPAWRRSCERHGLETVEFWRGERLGLDVRRSLDASEYLAKFGHERSWSLAAEQTLGRLKMGRSGSLTSWALLEQAILRGRDSDEFRLFLEYVRATYRKAWLSLRGAVALCKAAGIPLRLDDFKDANAGGEGVTVCKVSAVHYDRVMRAGAMAQFLESARREGAAGVLRFLS